ncbi:hypothetical protein LXL04_013019 [Taraxacum kok-saghyz]
MRGSQLYTALFFPSLEFFPTGFSLASNEIKMQGNVWSIDYSCTGRISHNDKLCARNNPNAKFSAKRTARIIIKKIKSIVYVGSTFKDLLQFFAYWNLSNVNSFGEEKFTTL